MAIENAVPSDFLSTFVDGIKVVDGRLPGVYIPVTETVNCLFALCIWNYID